MQDASRHPFDQPHSFEQRRPRHGAAEPGLLGALTALVLFAAASYAATPQRMEELVLISSEACLPSDIERVETINAEPADAVPTGHARETTD